MPDGPLLEIREPGLGARRMVLQRAIEVGCDCTGEVVSDGGVADRHLKLMLSPLGLSLVDLGTGSGTFVNGGRVEGRTVLAVGDVIRLGGTEIEVLELPGGLGRPSAPGPEPGPPPAEGIDEPVPEATEEEEREGALSHVREVGEWVFLGPITKPGEPVFPNYTEVRRRIPIPAWHAIRVVSAAAYFALVAGFFVAPAGAQFAFFKVVVPLLPLLFFVAPGLWRNICPLAAANQTPRVLGFTRGLTVPKWLGRYGYLVAITLFFGIAGARIAVFNKDGDAAGILLAVTIANAFAAGFLFKGKSGWCSSICPLLPLQRVYGQTPFVLVPNSHCQPCVGCTKNCYDFKPQVAYQADLHDADSRWYSPRKLFASALPGFVLGFFMLAGSHHLSNPQIYARLAVYLVGSIASFYILEAYLPLAAGMLTAVYGSVAINAFYWYSSVILASSFHTVTGVAVPWLRWPIRALVWSLTVIWITRTHAAASRFREAASGGAAPVRVGRAAARALAEKAARTGAQVEFVGAGKKARAEPGASILELAEKSGCAIEAGCRMGVCGADPVAIVEGMDGLSPPGEDELNTLRRLGYAANTRMACCARVRSGPLRVSLTPEPGQPSAGQHLGDHDRSILSVVIIGNGIAGVTAADFVRRGHPDCEIHLVGRESHVLYNRMGISRLVYGRSAMQGLYLLAEGWYDDHGVTAWINTFATHLDTRERRVTLGTGDHVFYDRLILAMGSSSIAPAIAGFGRPGSFVMRAAADAMAIRSYVQQTGSRRAVVAGAGLLGLEAAYSLLQLGLEVTVLERGDRLLARQFDARCSQLVHGYFEETGIKVLYNSEAEHLEGGDRVDTLVLKDGTQLPCDVFLAAIGIQPNVDLAVDAGVAVRRGVVVDDRMETSMPGVFAAGDVAEHHGMVIGLWPIAAKQAEVAAVNALGGDERLVAEVPATILKGVGLELSAVGRVEPEPGEDVIVVEGGSGRSYRRLVLAGGQVMGAVILGHHPEDMTAATAAVKRHAVLDDAGRSAVEAGDWSVLATASDAVNLRDPHVGAAPATEMAPMGHGRPVG